MAEKQHFLTLFGYNDQANRRILEAAQKVSAENYNAENEYSHGSLHGLLFHTLRTEHVWRTILLTGTLQIHRWRRKVSRTCPAWKTAGWKNRRPCGSTSRDWTMTCWMPKSPPPTGAAKSTR